MLHLRYFVLKMHSCVLVQSAAVQSGERIMEYGQSIVDGEVARGQIPRLLGTFVLSIAIYFE